MKTILTLVAVISFAGATIASACNGSCEGKKKDGAKDKPATESYTVAPILR